MKLLLRSILLFLTLAAFLPDAHGQLTVFKNDGAGDTNFANPNNWDNGVPDANTRAAFVTGWHSDAQNPGIVLQGGGLDIVLVNSAANQAAGALSIFGNFDNLSPGTTTGTVSLTFSGAGNTLTVTNGIEVNGGDTFIFKGNLTVQNGPIQIGDGTSFDGGIVDSAVAGTGTLVLDSSVLDYGTAGDLLIGSGAANHGTVVVGIAGVSSSTIIAGNRLVIGDGGAGAVILNNSSVIQSGSVNGTSIAIGENGGGGTSGFGSLTLNDASQVNLSDGSSLLVGTSLTGTGGTGVVSQVGSASQVNMSGTAILSIGDTGSGTYALAAGALRIGANNTDTTVLDLGTLAGSTGTLSQSGGTLTARAATVVTIGDAGTGRYVLSGGTADFQNAFTLGAQATGNGAVVQSGGILTTENSVVSIGQVGTGLYQMVGGIATFNDGVSVGAQGKIIQSGGTMTIAGGDLAIAAGGSVAVGGTLRVGDTHITGAGRLDFAGGTLQITSATAGSFTDSLDSHLTNNTTIDATTLGGITSVNLNGDLTGSGGLTLSGNLNTLFIFGGNVAYTGVTTIAGGTLNSNTGQIASMSGINLLSNGTLNLNVANTGFAYAGALTGSGGLALNFVTAGDPFVLLNSSGFSGNVLLGGNGVRGNLQAYNGTFASIAEAAAGSGVVIGGASLSGAGAAPSSGVVTIVSATYTGNTLINGGFTLNANTLAGTVTNNGSLFALGSADLTNNGALALSTSSAIGSTYNVTGALTSNAGSSIAIRAVGNTLNPTADSFVATGVATINSDTTIKVTGTGNITTPIPIIVGQAGLTVTPGALPTVNSSLLYIPTLTLDLANNSIDLTTVQVPLVTFARTPNQAATAVPIDQAVNNPGGLSAGQQTALNDLLLPLNSIKSPGEISKALEELSPESLQYARDIAFENSTFLVQKMNGVDADLRAGYGGLDSNAISVVSPVFNSGLGRSMSSLFASNSAFHPPAPNGVNYYPDDGSDVPSSANISPSSASSKAASTDWNSSSQVISDSPNPYLAHQHPGGAETPRVSEFISGDAILADLNQNTSAANAPSSSASYVAASATAGVSFRMTSHLAAGVLFDYNHTDADTDNSGSKMKVDSYSPGLFATYFDHGFYANGLFSFGYNTYENTRNIAALGKSATSSPDGQQYVGDLDFGYDFHPDKNWVVGPTLGVTYTHLDINSFQETGAPGANLAVDSQSADSLRSRLGGHVIYQTMVGNVLLQPNISAMWQHEYLDDSDGITSSFHDFGSAAFTINTTAPTRDSALVGIGMTATLDNSLAFYLNYFADVGVNDYLAQSVIGGIKARF